MSLFKREDNDQSNQSNIQNHRTFMEKAWDFQHRMEARQQRIGKGKYGRVLKMARKPTDEEFSKTSKITGLGILAIGGLGFLIFLIVEKGAPELGKLLGLL